MRTKKNLLYIVINVIVLLFAFSSFFLELKIIMKSFFEINRLQNIVLWSTFLVLLGLLHLTKLVRVYMMIMEQSVPFFRFIKIYIKTTFVNVILPFKSGEIFRMYCFGRECNNYKFGILAIIFERVFDTCALLLFLLPMELKTTGNISMITILLGLLVIIVLFLFLFLPGIATYLNHFFVFRTSGRKTLRALKIIEEVQDWYVYSKKLISGRISFVFFLSIVAWTIEYGLVYIMAKELKIGNLSTFFSDYINEAFGRKMNELLSIYTIGTALVFGIIMLLVYFIDFGKRKKNET